MSDQIKPFKCEHCGRTFANRRASFLCCESFTSVDGNGTVFLKRVEGQELAELTIEMRLPGDYKQTQTRVIMRPSMVEHLATVLRRWSEQPLAEPPDDP